MVSFLVVLLEKSMAMPGLPGGLPGGLIPGFEQVTHSLEVRLAPAQLRAYADLDLRGLVLVLGENCPGAQGRRIKRGCPVLKRSPFCLTI